MKVARYAEQSRVNRFTDHNTVVRYVEGSRINQFTNFNTIVRYVGHPTITREIPISTSAGTDSLLLESGSYLLLESGDKLLLE